MVRKKRKSKQLKRFTKWHRRLGIVSAFFVLLLSITGFFLNHTSDFGLGKHYVSSSTLLSMYAIEEPELTAFALKENWVTQLGEYIYLNDKELLTCDGELAGIVSYESYWVLACSHELLLLTHEHVLIEKLGQEVGLPNKVSKVAGCGDEIVCVFDGETLRYLDLASLSWDVSPKDTHQLWSGPSALPDALNKTLTRQAKRRVITWEKLILDLHAGRYLGSLGPLFMDIIALLFVLFSVTGIYLWSRKSVRR